MQLNHSNNFLNIVFVSIGSRINNHSLCYGAEMDAFENVVKLDGPIDSNDIKGVELKVYLIFYFKKTFNLNRKQSHCNYLVFFSLIRHLKRSRIKGKRAISGDLRP